MAHFAQLDSNNKVILVTVGRKEDDGKELELSSRTGDTYKQTSYNTRGGVYYDNETNTPAADQSKAFRKNFAGIGYSFNPDLDAFIPPQPYPSWALNEATCLWEAPVAKPVPPEDEQMMYTWDEETTSWKEIV